MKRGAFGNGLSSSLAWGLAWGLALATGAAAQAGPIQLTVDASQAPRSIVHTDMKLPVTAGPLTLLYPKWIPGEHEPDGPIGNLTGLRITANGQPIAWQRDPLDAFTFHLTVPAGVSQIEVAFDYLEASTGEFSSGGSSTDKLIDLNWNQNLLYPAGTPAEAQQFQATLRLPEGWKFGTPLAVAGQNGNQVDFKPVALDELVDSPVIAGQYYRAFDITPRGEPIHHELDIVADSEAALDLNPEIQQDMTNLVAESGKLFGTRHYRSYRFLLTLSDHVAHFGLEHHECDDSRLPERVLVGGGGSELVGELLPHEFMHSWNGKFRRPADLASPPYEAPMQDDLLWVYEGLTDFLGNMEATRSGLWSQGEYRQWLASISAMLGPGRPGRTWRPLIDTATAEMGMFEDQANDSWVGWRRSTDYYEEGDLLWLEVAMIVHDQTHGRKSIEDFLHAFYGGPNRGPELKPYTYDDIVAALQAVCPYDWNAFFQARLNSLSPTPPEGGIAAGGWKFALDDPGRGAGDLRYSLGLSLDDAGKVVDSIVGSPAYKAGVSSGMKLVGVNGRVYTRDLLNDAVEASASSQSPIELLVENDDYLLTCLIDYHDGPKAPRLEREPGKTDYLSQFLQPLAEH